LIIQRLEQLLNRIIYSLTLVYYWLEGFPDLNQSDDQKNEDNFRKFYGFKQVGVGLRC